MILIAKAQGLKRDGVLQTFPHENKNVTVGRCSINLHLFKKLLSVLGLSMSNLKSVKKILLFYRCSVVFLFENINRIINDCIYFLQLRLIKNYETGVFGTLVFYQQIKYKEIIV